MAVSGMALASENVSQKVVVNSKARSSEFKLIMIGMEIVFISHNQKHSATEVCIQGK